MAKTLPIIINPNPILRKKSTEVKAANIISPRFKRLILDMEKTMTEKDGAGLAAPQVGQNVRLLVMNANHYGIIVMINPKITKKSWAKEIDEEGCLSVLDSEGHILYAPIARHKKINCLYINALGQKQKIIAEGLLARIIQHEVDHLDGILFIDYLTDKKVLRTLSDEEKDARRKKTKAE